MSKLMILILLIVYFFISCTNGVLNKSQNGIKEFVDEDVKIEPFTLYMSESESAKVITHGYNNFIITDTSLYYYKTFILEGSDSIVLLDTIVRNTGLQKVILKSKINEWGDIYENKKIMITSGQNIVVYYNTDSDSSSSVFFNYYFIPLHKIIDSLNIYLKEENKILYNR